MHNESFEDKLKNKMVLELNNYIYKFSTRHRNLILKYTKDQLFKYKDFDKTIENDNDMVSKAYVFLMIIERYVNQSSLQVYNKIIVTTTFNQKNKKQKALEGAENIINFLGGAYSDNENARKLKSILRDFINNTLIYEVDVSLKNRINTKADIRQRLNNLLPRKSKEIDNFLSELDNFNLIIK